MEYDFDIYQLSSKFLADYPEDTYPELMYKQGRPYCCLLIDTHDDYFICVPYRSFINHTNAFLFDGTQRSMNSPSGLDYSKIVIIKSNDYLDNVRPIVDRDEYNETVKNIQRIARDALTYVDTYVKHMTGVATIHPRQFARKYQYSTLPYFHPELGISC